MEKSQKRDSLELMLQTSLSQRYQKTTVRDKNCAVIYTRVSSQEQAENNSSLETQLKLCTQYASREGLIVKKCFGGTYESAKTDFRKSLQEMLNYIKKDSDISCIIVYNYDRFSRTGAGAAQLSAELERKGVMIKSVTQDIDNSTPTGKLQENMLHLFNNYDN